MKRALIIVLLAAWPGATTAEFQGKRTRRIIRSRPRAVGGGDDLVVVWSSNLQDGSSYGVFGACDHLFNDGFQQQ
jgi:hypothetical protein